MPQVGAEGEQSWAERNAHPIARRVNHEKKKKGVTQSGTRRTRVIFTSEMTSGARTQYGQTGCWARQRTGVGKKDKDVGFETAVGQRSRNGSKTAVGRVLAGGAPTTL